MRIAIAGVGKRAVKVLNYLRAEMPEIAYVGYVDPAPAHLDALKGAGDVPGFAEVPEMLSATAPDLFFIGSPNHLHLEHIRAGLEAGVRVFTEKPVVISLDQTWTLAELLQQHGTDRLMVGLVLRYAQQMKDLRAAMAAGQLGRIVSIEANEHIEPQHGGFFMRDWRRYRALSGGFMLEKCCHDLDLYHMITGSRPQRVASFGGRGTFLPENAPGDADAAGLYQQTHAHWNTVADPFLSDGDIIDHQTAILEFASGVRMSFHTNINTPDESRHFCIIGTKGMAEGDLQRGYLRVTDARTSARLSDIDYTTRPEAQIDHYGSDKQMAEELAAHLRGGGAALPVSVVDALEAGISAMAIDEARDTGTVVDLTPIWERFDSYRLRETARAHAV